MELDNPLFDRLLARWPQGVLATTTRELSAHAVPVVFCADGGVVFIPVDGKRKRHVRLKRFDNVAAHPAASLLLTHYDPDWQALWWVRIDGQAGRFEAEPERGRRLGEALSAKYPQYRDPALAFDAQVWLRLIPARAVAWSHEGSDVPIRMSLEALD